MVPKGDVETRMLPLGLSRNSENEVLLLPRRLQWSWVVILLIVLAPVTVLAAQSFTEPSEPVDLAKIQVMLSGFQRAFSFPTQFSADVVVSLQGQIEPLSMELAGTLEVYDQDLYRFSYYSPDNLAGRRVVVSDGLGYAYWTNKGESGDWLYYPQGVGYLIPMVRLASLGEYLGSLLVLTAQREVWSGQDVLVLDIIPDPSVLKQREQQEPTVVPWTGRVWLDWQRGVPLRYELSGDQWREILEVSLVQRDDDSGQITAFTLSGVGHPSGEQLVAVFRRHDDHRWFPTMIRVTSEMATMEMQLSQVEWDQHWERRDLEVALLEEMRINLQTGQAARAEGDFTKMAQSFTKVVQLDPYNIAVHLDLGYAYLILDDDVKAEAHLQQALMLDSKLAVAYNNLAYLYIEGNRHIAKAVSLAETAVGLEPNNAAYLDTLGWGYYHQGRYLEAVRLLKRALAVGEDQLDPQALPEVYYHLALAYWASGAEAAAAKAVKDGLKAADVDSPFRQELVKLAQELEIDGE